AAPPAAGGTCRRRTRPPCSMRESGQALPPPLRTPPAAANRHAAPAPDAAPEGSPSGSPDTGPRALAARLSPIHLAHHGVERADDRDQVGDEGVAYTGRGRLERDEARRPELHAPRFRPPVRDEEAAELPSRRLDRRVDLALGHPVALGDDLEVVDQRLHRRVELLARRQHDLAVVSDPRLP